MKHECDTGCKSPADESRDDSSYHSGACVDRRAAGERLRARVWAGAVAGAIAGYYSQDECDTRSHDEAAVMCGDNILTAFDARFPVSE